MWAVLRCDPALPAACRPSLQVAALLLDYFQRDLVLVCLTAVDRVVVLQFQQIKFGEVYLFNVYLRLPSNQTCLWAGHCSRESGGSIKAESQAQWGGVGLIPGFLAMDHTVASSPSE